MTAQQIKVSIADDHKIFRDGIKMALKDREYLKILWEAEDGKDLLHKLKMKQPDVLLMDIRMPEMDGIQVLEQLKADRQLRDLPVIVTSAIEAGAFFQVLSGGNQVAGQPLGFTR